jgi:putative flippase GtrA
MAAAAEEKTEEMNKRTFDPKGLVRLAVVGSAATAAAYFVLWTQVWGRWAFSPIVACVVGALGMSFLAARNDDE